MPSTLTVAADFGIDDDFIKTVASRMEPGTSALSCSPTTRWSTRSRPR